MLKILKFIRVAMDRLTVSWYFEGSMPAALYDWEKWFARPKQFVLRRGADYSCPQSTMVQQIRNAASKRGIAVRVDDRGDEILVTKEEAEKK